MTVSTIISAATGLPELVSDFGSFIILYQTQRQSGKIIAEEISRTTL